MKVSKGGQQDGSPGQGAVGAEAGEEGCKGGFGQAEGVAKGIRARGRVKEGQRGRGEGGVAGGK